MPKPGVWVYDLGQNCSMIPRVTVRGPAGTRVRITQGELLKTDGTVSQQSSGEGAYCVYTTGGTGVETWSPRFFYYGSRYVQIEGAPWGWATTNPTVPGGPVLLKLEGLYVTSSAPIAGAFSCSNDQFDKTAEMIGWAIGSNTVSVLTDCPHREKLGWLEEDHLMGPSLMYSHQMQAMFEKVAGDTADSQSDDGLVPDIAPEFVRFDRGFRDSPEWGSAAVLVPWQLYQWYGDVRSVARPLRHDAALRRFSDRVGTRRHRFARAGRLVRPGPESAGTGPVDPGRPDGHRVLFPRPGRHGKDGPPAGQRCGRDEIRGACRVDAAGVQRKVL